MSLPTPSSAARDREIGVRWTLATAGVAIVLAAIPALLLGGEWGKVWLVASITTVVSTLLSIVPLAWALGRQPTHAAAGWFLATAIRLPVVVGGVAFGVWRLELPEMAVIGVVMAQYFLVLGTEAAVVGRALWDKAEPRSQTEISEAEPEPSGG